MSVSFRDYVTIVDAFEEAQLDEGKIWDAIKKKLGGKASDKEIEAEVERLKGMNTKDLSAIKKSAASKSFHDRKAAEHAKAAAAGTRQTQTTRATVAHDSFNRLAATPTANMTVAQAKATERNWMGEDLEAQLDGYLAEGVCEFTVTYTTKQGGGGKKSKMDIKGRDVKEVRRKFADLFFGHKLLNIAPCRTKPKREEPAEDLDEAHEEHGPLGPRT